MRNSPKYSATTTSPNHLLSWRGSDFRREINKKANQCSDSSPSRGRPRTQVKGVSLALLQKNQEEQLSSSPELLSVNQSSERERALTDTDVEADSSELSEASTTHSNIVIIPPSHRPNPGPRLRVEILSLRLEPSSPVALDKSVHRLFVEYRLLGVPLESTETPMSLRKPSGGQEVHYNFTRVIYVDGTHAAPLRHYLFTMLEGTDPHQGRLKFTVVSEPLDEEDECVDVGRAFLDLRDLLETGEDILEQDIQIVGVGDDGDVIGHLKVSLEAAVALSGIYREFHQQEDSEESEEPETRVKKKADESD